MCVSMSPREINMSKSRKLSALFAATVAISMMTGTSAFAETRHRDETQPTARNEQNRNDRGTNRQWNSNFNDRNGSRQGNSTYDNRSGRQNNSNDNFRNNDRNNNTNSNYNRNDRRNNSPYHKPQRRTASFQSRVHL